VGAPFDLVEDRAHVVRGREILAVVHDRVDVHEVPVELGLGEPGPVDRGRDAVHAEKIDQHVRGGVIALFDHRVGQRVYRNRVAGIVGVEHFRAAHEVGEFQR
jgi:hypothetical protein